ncbi:uncharacterized protein TNCV_4163731 [Trichonephila clavipes]|nr:uncharacterized protein TNCV_4163731 [Trichonephila clavipes]
MPRSKKYFLLFWGLLETWVFSGSILGWSALHYMLKQEGVYGHLCNTFEVPSGNSSADSLLAPLVSPVEDIEETILPSVQTPFSVLKYSAKSTCLHVESTEGDYREAFAFGEMLKSSYRLVGNNSFLRLPSQLSYRGSEHVKRHRSLPMKVHVSSTRLSNHLLIASIVDNRFFSIVGVDVLQICFF